jgi:LL-diaminopimelate aminotransferase
MVFINENYTKLAESYLFSTVAKKREEYRAAHPEAEIINLGIGDVTKPLCPAVISAMQDAVQDMASAETFHGYGPEQGYDFLKEAIRENDYAALGVEISLDEIFISDGSKSDTGNIGDILGIGNIVAIPDPVYPVYVDTNIMAGRTIKMLPTNEANGFCAEPPDFHADIVYLCSPNNPTGSTLDRAALTAWVDYARHEDALLLFDAAYKAFITDPAIPRSIYEIPGAKECAIEFCSFSKTAGFTGTRCAYTIVPKALIGKTPDGKEIALNGLWNRRHTTKFNGTPYIVQKGAAAIYTPEGKQQIAETLAFYKENARIIKEGLTALGFTCFGGENSPYIWLKAPNGMTSWDFFDLLLTELNIVGTPGSGFGSMGEGYFRLTAFGSREATEKAMERFKAYFGK